MGSVTVVYTKKYTSLFSWLIRWALPVSRFKLGQTSHGYIQDFDNPLKYYEATLFFGFKAMLEAIKTRDISKMTGVREVSLSEVQNNTIVKTAVYDVPNVREGMEWLRGQVGKRYDLRGAIGLGITPTRNWAEDDSWNCYELIAGTLKYSGLNVFNNISHVTEIALFAIKSKVL